MRWSAYLGVLCAIWVIAMTWRIYPDFSDRLRFDGRLMSFADYLEESCGQRIGPAAASCLAEARITGKRLVASEQAKSLLLIEAPLLCYLVYFPFARAMRRRAPGGAEQATAQ